MSLLAKTVFAQMTFNAVSKNTALNDLLTKITDAIVVPIVLGLFIVAGVVFVWGVFGLIRHADDPKAREEGQSHILWGVIGMVIMIGAYGIIRLIAGTLGMQTDPFF